MFMMTMSIVNSVNYANRSIRAWVSQRSFFGLIVCACPYSSNIGLSAMTLYYPVQDKTTTRPVNTQNYYTKI